MIPEIFLTCAMSMPVMSFPGKMLASVNHQVTLTKMLLAFTSEFTYSENKRILIIGDLWKMVREMRRQKLNAFGLSENRSGSKYVARGKDIVMPFKGESFRMVISPRYYEKILQITAMMEIHRILIPGGFAIVPSEYKDIVHIFFTGLGYTRLPFGAERMTIFQKRGRPRIYWGPLERAA